MSLLIEDIKIYGKREEKITKRKRYAQAVLGDDKTPQSKLLS